MTLASVIMLRVSFLILILSDILLNVILSGVMKPFVGSNFDNQHNDTHDNWTQHNYIIPLSAILLNVVAPFIAQHSLIGVSDKDSSLLHQSFH